MEDTHSTEGKIITTIKFSTGETTSTKLSDLSFAGRVSQLGQHLYILKTSHTNSNPATEEGTFFQ